MLSVCFPPIRKTVFIASLVVPGVLPVANAYQASLAGAVCTGWQGWYRNGVMAATPVGVEPGIEAVFPDAAFIAAIWTWTCAAVGKGSPSRSVVSAG